MEQFNLDALRKKKKEKKLIIKVLENHHLVVSSEVGLLSKWNLNLALLVVEYIELHGFFTTFLPSTFYRKVCCSLTPSKIDWFEAIQSTQLLAHLIWQNWYLTWWSLNSKYISHGPWIFISASLDGAKATYFTRKLSIVFFLLAA